MKNLDIREAITKAGLKFWEVADAYGCTDGNFSRKLRKEFTLEQKERVFEIIRQLKEERAHEQTH